MISIEYETPKMTLFQARFIQWLTLIGCSIRATDAHFKARYPDFYEGGKTINHKWREEVGDGVFTFGGNQINGIIIRKQAAKLIKDSGDKPHFNEMGNNIGYDDDSYIKWRKKIKQNGKS